MRSVRKTALFLLLLFLFGSCLAEETAADSRLSYEDFKKLSNEEQIAVFSSLSSPEIYALVQSSETENWPVTAYDLVTEENAGDFIILNESYGSLSFNLNWPIYGGYDAETIASIGELNGTVEVSRDGGDGGYTVRTGVLDIDRYKQAV